jgi:DDE family transposase
MLASRLGSLNALEQVKGSPFLEEWIGGSLPSVDSIARICNLIDPATVRGANHELYARLKRGKAIVAPGHGLMALVVDGHESHATYRQRCPGCLERRIQTAAGEKIQYYHRNVSAMLTARDFELFLDTEPQRPGEDEIATALRLLERLLAQYPRAFDVVLGDAFYTDPRFYNFLIAHGKDVLTVLKSDVPSLLEDATSLSAALSPTLLSERPKKIEAWDMEGFTSWPQVQKPVRIVRSRETSTIRRQLDGKQEELTSEWFWVTTLELPQANTKTVVEVGHSRWIIENHGFNETTTEWHADHVYMHEPGAILVFGLLCMIAFNLFHAFFARNLKPALKQRVTMRHVARTLLEQLYRDIHKQLPQPP